MNCDPPPSQLDPRAHLGHLSELSELPVGLQLGQSAAEGANGRGRAVDGRSGERDLQTADSGAGGKRAR